MAILSLEREQLGSLCGTVRRNKVALVPLHHDLSQEALENVKFASGNKLYFLGCRTDVIANNDGPFTVAVFGYKCQLTGFGPEVYLRARRPDYFVAIGCHGMVAEILDYQIDFRGELILRATGIATNLDPRLITTAT